MRVAKPKKGVGWRCRLGHDGQAAPFDWLFDTGSLTARLQERGTFRVDLLRQCLARPTRDEARELGISQRHLARIREVALFCDGRPVVFAHTVLPRRPRGPLTDWLDRLGNRSLGALLFSHPGFARGVIGCRRLDRRHPLHAPAAAALQLDADEPRVLWARRSRFSFGHQQLLVTEVFAPILPGSGTR